MFVKKKTLKKFSTFFYFFAEEPSERFELTQKNFPQERKKKNFSAQTKKRTSFDFFCKGRPVEEF